MSPAEILEEVTARGARLRLNAGGFTITRKHKLTPELTQLIRDNRSAIIELLESGDSEDVPLPQLAPEPPPVGIAERLIAHAREEFRVEVKLDHPQPWGRLLFVTPWDRPVEVPEGVKDDLPEKLHIVRNRTQVPAALGALLNTYREELLAYLRAPYIPKPPPLPPDATPQQRSIWERMAVPDSLVPNQSDNQARVKKLLFGDADGARAKRREQAFSNVLPFVTKDMIPRK